MYLVKVYVTFADSVVNPAAEATKNAAHRLGFTNVEELAIGKFIELQVAKGEEPIETTVEALCQGLLANPNTETYTYEIQEVGAP